MPVTSEDQYREKLSDYVWTMIFWGFWGDTDISDIDAIRQEFDQRIAFCDRTLRELEDWVNRSGVRLVHQNNNPKPEQPSGMSSPIKTDEIRLFEEQVRTAFGLDESTSATTHWPEQEALHFGAPAHDVRRQLHDAIDDFLESIFTPAKDAPD